jgi:hypothetical protein
MSASGNDFGGSAIPFSFHKLSQMEVLDFSLAGLGGPLPSFILDGTWPNLEFLSLYGNALEGSLTDDIGKMSNLGKSAPLLCISTQGVRLNFVGCGPVTRAKEILILNGNRLQGSIPQNIGNCTQLEAIKIQGNQFTGTVPSTIGQLTSLGTSPHRRVVIAQRSFAQLTVRCCSSLIQK